MKIDRRISYKIVLDCESCPLDKERTDVSPWNMFAYDLGWQVVDKRGRVYAERSYVIADIFLDEKSLMQSAYYANKIPQYWEEIKSGERTLTSFYRVLSQFKKDIETFKIKQVFAHNMRFDYGTLQNTQRWLTKSKYRNFFPYGVEICDTLKMARQLIATMPTYKKFCIDNGYLTKRNQPRLTAEIIYRFISGNNDFKEVHKGLDDVRIEKEILAYCYRKHKSFNPRLWE